MSRNLRDILLLTKTKIINNQFITLQRSYTFRFFAVNDLLLVCCKYVKFFQNTSFVFLFPKELVGLTPLFL